MARLSRLDVVQWPHLLVQHVREGERLVRDEVDRQMLWMAMLDAARQTLVAVHAYAVLDNHFHLVVTPTQPGTLGTFMQAIGRRYVARYNHRHGRTGTLWDGRFRGTVLTPEQHLIDAILFVETHPGLHLPPQGVASGVSEFGYSSVLHHVLHHSDPLVQDHALFWALGNTPFEREGLWRRRLQLGLSFDERAYLAEAMLKGWALVDPAQRAALERATGRRMAPRPRGRPRKTGRESTAMVPSLIGAAPFI
jgi:putative transposase